MVASDYLSFLLRLWQVSKKGNEEWRASLENVKTGEKCGFTRLNDLYAYINLITGDERKPQNEEIGSSSKDIK